MKDKRHFKSIRASMILMILVLVTSCIVAGTYAKYVSSKTVVENARIAKFGVTIDGGGNAFAKSYDSDGQARVSFISVFSTDSVVAPGTEGTMDSITVSGKPEVSVKVEFKGKLSIKNWQVTNEQETEEFYCPIIITVGEREFDGTEYQDAVSFEKDVNDAIPLISKEYDVNEGDFEWSEFNEEIPNISWKWIFDRENEEYDNYDTQLGDKADATITLTVTATVTQLD